MSELFYNRVNRLNTMNDSVYSVNIMLFYRIFLHFTYEAIQTTGVYIYIYIYTDSVKDAAI